MLSPAVSWVRALTSVSWQLYSFLVCLPKVKCRIFTCYVAKKALFSFCDFRKPSSANFILCGDGGWVFMGAACWISPLGKQSVLWTTALYLPVPCPGSASIVAVGCFLILFLLLKRVISYSEVERWMSLHLDHLKAAA